MKQIEKKKVLIVDDDGNFLELVKDAFSDYLNVHLIIHHIISGLDVIDDVVALKPDILFLDIKLPDISGVLLGDLLRRETKMFHFPIYLISAWKEEEFEGLLSKILIEGFVHKSEFMNNILRILEKHFGSGILKK